MAKKKIPVEVKKIQNNPAPPPNWAFQKNISHSQMNIYKDCPHHWKLRYKDKLRPFTSNIHSVFGSAIHEVIQTYLDLMYNVSIVKANELNMEEMFQTSLLEHYNKEYKANKNQHFSEAIEMREAYDDGVEIIKYFKKKKGKIFSKRGWHLVGCEVPISVALNPAYPNVLYMGYLDVLLYHAETKEFHIIDLKTSIKGWSKWQKSDEKKTSQLILYKKALSIQFDIPLDKISVEFVILKRKLWENSDFIQTRLQSFIPSAGKTKIKKSLNLVDNFITEVFTNGNLPKIKDKEYPKNPSEWNCRYCPFLDDKKQCGEGIKVS